MPSTHRHLHTQIPVNVSTLTSLLGRGWSRNIKDKLLYPSKSDIGTVS